jgi:sugar phosphate isomerase/epimerase
LETHGNFCGAAEVQSILNECPAIRLVWDPASAFTEHRERPVVNGNALQKAVRHVHIKDLRMTTTGFKPVLTGEGEFPLAEIRCIVDRIEYRGFLSFEWEKKWHPEIEPPEIAIPHFSNWFRLEWEKLAPLHDPEYVGIGVRL